MNAQEELNWHIKSIEQEIKLWKKELSIKKRIQEAENDKEFELLERFEKWSDNLTRAQKKIEEGGRRMIKVDVRNRWTEYNHGL